jgi:hypothetical protein
MLDDYGVHTAVFPGPREYVAEVASADHSISARDADGQGHTPVSVRDSDRATADSPPSL